MNSTLFRLVVWFLKNVLTVTIIILVLSPKSIHREELSTPITNFQFVYNHTNFQPRHLFCDIPKFDLSLNENEDLEALNLPDGTLITEHLREFGRCIAEMKSDGKSIDPCTCRKRTSYVLLLASSIVALFVDYVRYCVLPVICQCFRSMDSMYSYNQEYFVFVVGILWFVVGCVSIAFHIHWYDEIWLPDAIYSQNYFERPPQWTMAVALAFVSCVFCLVECLCMKLRRKKLSSENEVEKQQKQIEMSTVEPEEAKVVIHKSSPPVEDGLDTWSVESYPEDVKDRLTWRVSRKTGNKSWP